MGTLTDTSVALSAQLLPAGSSLRPCMELSSKAWRCVVPS